MLARHLLNDARRCAHSHRACSHIYYFVIARRCCVLGTSSRENVAFGRATPINHGAEIFDGLNSLNFY